MTRYMTYSRFIAGAICLTLLALASIGRAQSPVLQPRSDARLVYVSPERGNDANHGTHDAPVRTADRGLALLRNGYGDWLLLERGHEYRLEHAVMMPRGAAPDVPIVIAAFGSGETPELHVGPNRQAFSYQELLADYITVGPTVQLTGLADPFPILQPGNGWAGPTPQPDPVGKPGMPGYDAKAIARWDVVPYQTFEGDFHIGVVAFHMNGIDRVEFSVEGGPWTPVHQMQLNPRTNVWEYTATLRASLFEDGPIEVRAIAWPKQAGEPRVLDSLRLNADADGSILANREIRYVSTSGSNETGDGSPGNPFASIRHAARSIHAAQGGNADNGLIYLMEGDHLWAGTSDSWRHPITEHAWLTIAPAPGATAQNVRINSGGGDRLNASLVHIQAITVRTGLASSTNLNAPAKVWFDRAVLEATGPGHGQSFASPTAWTGGIYSTDTTIQNVRSGFKGGTLIERNVILRNLGEDAFFNPRLVINAFVDGIDTTGVPNGPHPDLLQWHGVHENAIVYGLKGINCSAQGIFSRAPSTTPSTDIAVVNVLVEMHPNKYLNQWLQSTNHLLLWNVTLANRPLRISDDPDSSRGPTILNNLSIRNSVFAEVWLSSNNLGENAVIDNNHFVTGSHAGTKPSSGNPQFVNAKNNDYRPAINSPLLNRVSAPLTPADLHGRAWEGSPAIGAIGFNSRVQDKWE